MTQESGNADNNSDMAYSVAVESYLSRATWLTALDEPLKVHARALARSLDNQLQRTGEIQSALASSFDKCLWRLDQRRPQPSAPPSSLSDSGPTGEQSIFDIV